jgi:protein-L-isoaspartate(D-aspartate) O-methyltransferase
MVLQRTQMVEKQLKSRSITDPIVLHVMELVPRHLFLEEGLGFRAYDDCPMPIGYGQFISQPYMVAYMTQALQLKRTDAVLEIGSGCGYQTAVLALMAKQVLAIEIIPQLREKSLTALTKLGLNNVLLKLGDGRLGWPEMAPFNAILVAAYSETLPKILFDQLAVGGRMIIPLGPENNQKLVMIVKDENGVQRRQILERCRFVPLVNG